MKKLIIATTLLITPAHAQFASFTNCVMSYENIIDLDDAIFGCEHQELKTLTADERKAILDLPKWQRDIIKTGLETQSITTTKEYLL